MKKQKQLAEYIRKKYMEHNQRLYLHGGFVEELGNFYSQEVFVMDIYQPDIEIQLKDIAKRSNEDLDEIKRRAKKKGLYKEEYYGKYLFEIRTLDYFVGYDNLGNIPYFTYKDGWPIYTVPKFGELTKEDIYKAIEHFIHKELKPFLIFNIYYEGKMVYTRTNYDLEKKMDIEELRSYNHFKSLREAKTKRKVRAKSKSKVTRQEARKAARKIKNES